MNNELFSRDNKEIVDSFELLIRFIDDCKNKMNEKNDKSTFGICADIVTAIHYYRRYPEPNDFIREYLSDCNNYFQIQWVRSTWAYLSKLPPSEVSDLVINQITSVANSEEEDI